MDLEVISINEVDFKAHILGVQIANEEILYFFYVGLTWWEAFKSSMMTAFESALSGQEMMTNPANLEKTFQVGKSFVEYGNSLFIIIFTVFLLAEWILLILTPSNFF